ncbi:OmpA family protein [Methylobrevis albus]|uniref:OmpA family protein n=1 Tax=Methylobrevis albus TaxID=2793297 RepID=A0A931I075_9HYPH|nr:OmpA family protein [Methylobrevis albus]MBH0236851.1 OmpA family protein [Methylobrevis albus]
MTPSIARLKQVLLVALAVGVAAPPAALAGGTDTGATAIIRRLAPITPPSVDGGGTDLEATSIARRPARVAATSLANRPQTVLVDHSRSLDFDIFFAFDSAELDATARAALTDLGRALAGRELGPYAFLVAGHTDAKGSAGYNLKLSAARAAAVAQYLTDAFPIEPERLYTVGFGASQPRVPAAPLDGRNRRVEVILVAGTE